jgi:hypothetical protein
MRPSSTTRRCDRGSLHAAVSGCGPLRSRGNCRSRRRCLDGGRPRRVAGRAGGETLRRPFGCPPRGEVLPAATAGGRRAASLCALPALALLSEVPRAGEGLRGRVATPAVLFPAAIPGLQTPAGAVRCAAGAATAAYGPAPFRCRLQERPYRGLPVGGVGPLWKGGQAEARNGLRVTVAVLLCDVARGALRADGPVRRLRKEAVPPRLHWQERVGWRRLRWATTMDGTERYRTMHRGGRAASASAGRLKRLLSRDVELRPDPAFLAACSRDRRRIRGRTSARWRRAAARSPTTRLGTSRS